jgi:hypothetical protein
MKSLFFLAATAVLATAASAQSDDARPYNGPVKHVGTYHVATGTWTYADEVGGADGTTVCYNNGGFSGSVTTTPNTTNLGREYVDWGTFATCGPFGTNSMTKFTIGWGTNIGTPVGNVVVSFYSGTNPTVGGPYGIKGTLIQSYTIGPFGGSSAPGTLQAFTADIDISGTPITVPNGPIGWSYRIPTAITGASGAVAPAFGFLLCTIPAGSGAGNVDLFDRYNVGGSFQGTFNFGAGANLSSFYMRMTMDDNAPPCNGGVTKYGAGAGGINTGGFAVGGTGKLGSLVTIACSNPQTPVTATTAFMYFSTAPASFDPGLGGTVLILPPAFKQQKKVFPNIPGSTATFPQTIPNDLALDGVHIYGQALYLNVSSPTPFRLTDGAVDIWINNCP